MGTPNRKTLHGNHGRKPTSLQSVERKSTTGAWRGNSLRFRKKNDHHSDEVIILTLELSSGRIVSFIVLMIPFISP
jgi:hypothetical protein